MGIRVTLEFETQEDADELLEQVNCFHQLYTSYPDYIENMNSVSCKVISEAVEV